MGLEHHPFFFFLPYQHFKVADILYEAPRELMKKIFKNIFYLISNTVKRGFRGSIYRFWVNTTQ